MAVVVAGNLVYRPLAFDRLPRDLGLHLIGVRFSLPLISHFVF